MVLFNRAPACRRNRIPGPFGPIPVDWALITVGKLQSEGRSSVITSASARAVWEIITDPKRIGEWSHETHDGDWIGRSNTAVPGARFSGSNRLGRLKWTRVNQVVEVHPAHHYSWRTVPSALYPDSTLWTITLEPHAEGTEIVQTFEVLRINPIINRLYYLVAPAHRQREAALTADLRRLADVAELLTSSRGSDPRQPGGPANRDPRAQP